MVARPDAAIFTVTPIDPPGHAVRMLHGELGPQQSPEATWTITDRPRRKQVIEFGGYPVRTLSVAAALSFADIEQSIETLLFDVERHLLWPVGPYMEPPVVRIQGPGVPPMVQMLTWVTTKITPDGESEERNPDGTRNLQFFTIDFIENSRAGMLLSRLSSPAQTVAERARASSPPAAGGGGSTGQPAPSGRTYTVKAGDTLGAIATRELGNFNRWHDIADLNGIRDPRTLKVGQVLRLP